MTGKQVKLFLADRTRGGLTTTEITEGWFDDPFWPGGRNV